MQVTNIATQPVRYVSEKVVCEMTGIPTSTLQKQRHYRRGIPYIKLGKNIRYSIQDVLDYMEGHRVGPDRGVA